MTTCAEESRSASEIRISALAELENYRDQALDLLRSSLSSKGATDKSAGFWSWKHLLNPFGESIGCIATAGKDQTLIGIRAMMRWEFIDQAGQKIVALRPVDTVTHLEWRGKGLFTKLTKYVLHSLDSGPAVLVFNTPNSNSLPGYEKMGWVRGPGLDILVKPRGIGGLIRGLCRSCGLFQVRGSALAVYGDQVVSGNSMTASQIEELLEFCSNCEADRPSKGLRTTRDTPFLQWRYFGNPNADYLFHITRDAADRLFSVVVLRRDTVKSVDAVFILDVFIKELTKKHVKRAVRGVVDDLPADVFLCHFAKGTTERSACLSGVFIPLRKKILSLRDAGASTMAQNAITSADKYSFDLTLSDLEIF